MPLPPMLKRLKLIRRPRRPPRTHTKKKKKNYVLFIIGDWNTKVGSKKILGAPGRIGLGVQNEEQQRLIVFWQENALVIANTLFHTTQETTLRMDITR